MNIYVQIAIIIISTYLAYTMQPKPQEPKPAAFSDIDVPQVEEGTPEIVVFGDVFIPDWTVVAMGNFRTTAIKQRNGKK